MAASALLHLFVFNWADGRIGLPSFELRQPKLITTMLHPVAQVPEKAAPAPVKPAHRAPRKKPKPRPAKPAEPAPPAPPQADTSVEPAGLQAPVSAPSSEDAPAAPPSSAENEAAEPSEQAAALASRAGTVYKTNPPPSAELKYRVTALRDHQYYYAGGTITWNSDGEHYLVRGEAGILFFTVLNFKSEGMIDGFGVSPVLYSEKRFRKAETNTHFHRERNTISFSASTISYPRVGGEQDRGSVVWQLASMGRGDSEKFFPDAEFDIFVVGARDGEVWQFRVIGEEEIETGLGNMPTWHVVRVPRPGSYEQKLDIWLAPQQEWYPVKLRYTETNGDYLDLSLSKISGAQ